jgi:hypothetical protein
VWLGTQNLRWDAQRGSEVAIVSDFMTTIVWSIYFKFAFSKIQLIQYRACDVTLSVVAMRIIPHNSGA